MENGETVKKEDCKNNHKIMSEKIENLKDSLNDFKIEIIEKISEIPDKLDKRYASKLTETIVYGLVALIIITIAGVGLNLVLKSNNTNSNIEQIISALEQKYDLVIEE